MCQEPKAASGAGRIDTVIRCVTIGIKPQGVIAIAVALVKAWPCVLPVLESLGDELEDTNLGFVFC